MSHVSAAGFSVGRDPDLCSGGHLVERLSFIRLRRLFVAPFPIAMIKNNNSDNGVPSMKQLAEIPTSVSLKRDIGELLCPLPQDVEQDVF